MYANKLDFQSKIDGCRLLLEEDARRHRKATIPSRSRKIKALQLRDENGTDIFRPYSKPNPFKGVEICPYPSPDIQHPIPYPYPNTQIAYL